jgi:cysteine-S-conjugate beta-lyase
MLIMITPTQHLSTRLIHHPYVAPPGFDAPAMAVHKASTVFFPSVQAMRETEWKDKSGYTYGLHGTPTTFVLEERLAALEGGVQCLLLPSGLAAVANVSLALLDAGDEVLLPDNVYGPNKTLTEGDLQRWGITCQYYDPMSLADLERRLSQRTRLVWLEAPGSVTLEFPDLVAQARLCKDRGIWSALDNTWGAGLAFCPFDLLPHSDDRPVGADLSVHALTKYPSGGGDVLMGSVVTRNEALHMRLKLTHMRLGLGVGANDAELVLRGLPSMALRYAAQDASARAIALWASEQPEFVQVLHPALPSSPGHVHWRALVNAHADSADRHTQAGCAAGLVSVVFDPQIAQIHVDRFCDRLSRFRIGYSWGGPVSLVVPYDLASMRTAWPSSLTPGTVVRFSTGLEATPDLLCDLQAALEGLRADILTAKSVA